MKNILLLKGQSQYNAMRIYIDEFAKAFRNLGYNTLILDACSEDFFNKLELVKKQYHFDYVFSCNAILINHESIDFADYYASYICDHPVCHNERYQQADDKCLLIQCDGFQKNYVDEFYPNVGKSVFVPLSGSYDPEYIPYNNRKYDVVFTGTYTDPNLQYDDILSNFNEDEQPFVKLMINKIINNPDQLLEEILSSSLEEINVNVSNTEFHELMMDFFSVNQYARNYFRDKLIRSLVESGIQVHVFGSGWENFKSKNNDALIYHEGENEYLARKAVANAKISLNVMPWFKAGFQERIATAMLSGAISVTDSSVYIEENFTDGKDIIIYSLDHIENIVPRIKELLNHPEEAEKIANAGRTCASSKHTWLERTKEFVYYMKELSNDDSVQESLGTELSIDYTNNKHRLLTLSECRKNLEELSCLKKSISKYSSANIFDYNYMLNNLFNTLECVQKNNCSINLSPDLINLLICPENVVESYQLELLQLFINNILSELYKIDIKVINEKYNSLYSEYNSLYSNYEAAYGEYDTLCNDYEALYIKENDLACKYNKIIKERILRKYSNFENPYIQEAIENINKRGLETYNYDFVIKYFREKNLEDFGPVYLDEGSQMRYVLYNDKRLYYPRHYSDIQVLYAYRFTCMEQDKQSPHLYIDKNFNVDDGDVVIDAGAAEGNFALSIVDKVKKLYIIEYDPNWIEALEHTFAPYSDKVTIVKKMLSDVDDEQHISLDGLLGDTEVNFIKMDIEGFEIKALEGAKKTLARNQKLKLAICSYHKKNDEANISTIMTNNRFDVTTTDRYMFFEGDDDSLIDGELRHGIVRAIKKKHS